MQVLNPKAKAEKTKKGRIAVSFEFDVVDFCDKFPCFNCPISSVNDYCMFSLYNGVGEVNCFIADLMRTVAKEQEAKCE